MHLTDMTEKSRVEMVAWLEVSMNGSVVRISRRFDFDGVSAPVVNLDFKDLIHGATFYRLLEEGSIAVTVSTQKQEFVLNER